MLRTADKRLFVGKGLDGVFPRFEPVSATGVGQVSGSSAGTLITVGGVANTKTSWVELVASTSKQADGFLLNCQPGDTALTDYLVDIAIGGSGSEVAILSNLLFTAGGGDTPPGKAFFPIPIPPGTRISARAQSVDTAAVAVRVDLILLDGGDARLLTRRVATTYGADTSDSGGTAVDAGASTHTKGAWAQLSASLTNGFESCVICLGNRNNAANTAQNMLLDLGVGGSGSETVVLPDMYVRATAGEEVLPKWTWVPLRVNKGQRLAARVQSSSNDATDRVIDVVVIGFS